MKIAATVILYHPGPEVIANIQSYASLMGKIYVMDNTEAGAAAREQLQAMPLVQYFHDGENEGLSKRLNQACQAAMADGYEWLLTMDQDSIFTGKNLEVYFKCCETFPEKDNVALFGVVGARVDDVSADACAHKQSLHIMTSGSLMNMSLYGKLGGFDEALYIDSVDHDYNFKAALAGYKVILFLHVFLHHQLGTEVYRASIKSLFLKKKWKEIHSPLRLYYMYRNALYLSKKFEKQPLPELQFLRRSVLARIKRAVFYGRNTGEVLKYVLKARADFRQNKMGKIGQDK